MKVGVYGQYHTGEALNYIKVLLKTLSERKVEAIIEEEFYHLIQNNDLPEKSYRTFSSHEDLNSSYKVMLTVGGDGTFLRAVTFIRDLNIPVLGINVGRLGFLATIQKEAIPEAIDLLVNKKYEINERSLLTVTTDPENFELSEVNFALNEISVSRRNSTSMITVETYLDDEYLTSYWADGLIVATPTGSTGYSLSCGGPVITPSTKSLVLTPIAPHNLNARPLVIPDETKIKLKIVAREKLALISLDSRVTTVVNRTELYISKAPFTVKTVLLSDQTFLKTLREKLLWGEDKRN